MRERTFTHQAAQLWQAGAALGAAFQAVLQLRQFGFALALHRLQATEDGVFAHVPATAHLFARRRQWQRRSFAGLQ